MERYLLHPIRHPLIYKMYKDHVACFWTVDELDLSRDYADFQEKLGPEARRFIERVLAFFAFGDGVVMENIVTNFYNDVTLPEARQFYAVQLFSEAVHAETYSLLIQTLLRDEKEIARLVNVVQTSDPLNAKADWMIRFMDPMLPLPDRLVAYACVEGIFFSSSFASIFWLKTKNVCEGLCKSNEFISRDEGLHRDFAVALYKLLDQPTTQVREILSEAVEVEVAFMREALDVGLLGLNPADMADYIRFVADGLARDLGEDVLYGVANPLDFMDLISVQRKTNFFESRVSEYARSRVGLNSADTVFQLDAEF